MLYWPEENEPALKAKVDALIEQGIKDGTLNGLSEQWLKARCRQTSAPEPMTGATSFLRALAALAGAAGGLWVTFS